MFDYILLVVWLAFVVLGLVRSVRSHSWGVLALTVALPVFAPIWVLVLDDMEVSHV